MKQILILGTFILFSACSKKVYDEHNSMNSLDWQGKYTGMISQAGQDVEATLTLNNDKTYELIKGKAKSTGKFVWSKDGQKINLSGKDSDLHFFVGENFIQQVSKKGEKVGNGNFQLHKADLSIVEKYWKLVEINGKPVKVAEGMSEPHLILKTDENRVIGNGGCNAFNGKYELNEGHLRLRFDQVAATLKACHDMSVEDEFMKVIGMVDNYATDGKYLYLHKARMAPLAKLEVVYLR